MWRQRILWHLIASWCLGRMLQPVAKQGTISADAPPLLKHRLLSSTMMMCSLLQSTTLCELTPYHLTLPLHAEDPCLRSLREYPCTHMHTPPAPLTQQIHPTCTARCFWRTPRASYTMMYTLQADDALEHA